MCSATTGTPSRAATWSSSDVVQPSHGVATLSADGELEYVPAAGFEGWDSLSYRVEDPQGHQSAHATIAIFVGTPPPPPPSPAGPASTAGPGPGTALQIGLADGSRLKSGADGRSATFPIAFSAVQGATLTASSSSAKLVPSRAIRVTQGPAGSAQVTITVTGRRSGRAVVTLTISDGRQQESLAITVVVGTDRGERLKGTPGADFLVGLGGADRLSGRAGRDVLSGGAGADTLVGGPGVDTLVGGRGHRSGH